MISNVFCIVLLIILAEFSSQTIIESKCNDKLEPTKYTLFKPDGTKEVTAVFQMESTDAFDPVISIELVDHQMDRWRAKRFYNELFLISLNRNNYWEYYFVCYNHNEANNTCRSRFHNEQSRYSNCQMFMETATCKWLITADMHLLVDDRITNVITEPNAVEIRIGSFELYNIVSNDSSKLPIYQWSYARQCEHNKKIYDLDGDIITLKKGESSFELFIYRYITGRLGRQRNIELSNAKGEIIVIDCGISEGGIKVWTKELENDAVLGETVKKAPVLDDYVFKKHVDRLRCGISLSNRILGMSPSFSFNDTPLKLKYKIGDHPDDYIYVNGITFDSDSNVEDDLETPSTTTIDYQTIDENQENDKVNPLIGVCLTIITVIKAYFDLW